MSEYAGPERRHGQRRRWNLLTLWIVVFSAFVVWSFYDMQHQASQRRAERVAQINALHNTQVSDCRKSMNVITAILSASTQGRQLPPRSRERLSQLVAIADPKACGKLIEAPKT